MFPEEAVDPSTHWAYKVRLWLVFLAFGLALVHVEYGLILEDRGYFIQGDLFGKMEPEAEGYELSRGATFGLIVEAGKREEKFLATTVI